MLAKVYTLRSFGLPREIIVVERHLRYRAANILGHRRL